MAFSDPNLEKAYQLGRKSQRQDIVIKLIKRANHYLKNVDSLDSPIILIAAELKIQADEIDSLNHGQARCKDE